MPSSTPSAPIQTLAYAATDMRSMDARGTLPDNNNYKALEASHTHGHALVIAGGMYGPGRLAALSLSDNRNSSASDGLVHILNEHDRPAIEAAQRGVAYGRAMARAICHALGVPPPPNEKLVSTVVAVVGEQGMRVDGASITAGFFVEHALHQLCGISMSGTAVTGALEANGHVTNRNECRMSPSTVQNKI